MKNDTNKIMTTRDDVRLLTSDEIENIIDFIKPQKGIPIESAISIVNINKERLRKQLRKQMIYPEIIPKLKEKLEATFQKSLIQPGESVGIICAQSLGSEQTQNTLNTFHRAGQSEKSVLLGTPRFTELLNATKEPKMVNTKIFFKKKHETIKELKKTIGHQLVELQFAKISKSMTVCIDKSEEPWYKSFALLYSDEPWYKDHSLYQNCISIQINTDYCYEYRLTFEDIAKFIESEYDELACIFSPISIGRFDIFVDTSLITLPENRLLFITEDNAKEIYLEEVVQPTIEKMIIGGIAGIESIYYMQDESNGSNEWIVETDGTNFNKILAHPDIDETRTTSNNIWDIYNVLGIEAAREFLIQEFINIMGGINICHVKLLVERMTFAGTISSISRYTMRKDDGSVMGKLSFEESVDNISKSACNGERDNINGVSSSIICSKRAKIGTGMVDILIDIPKLPKVFDTITDNVS